MGTPDTTKAIDSRVEVHVTEAIGTVFLGILAIMLLVAFLRVVQRNRELEAEKARQV